MNSKDKILELTKQLNEVNQEREQYRNKRRMEYVKVLNKVNKIIEYIKN